MCTCMRMCVCFVYLNVCACVFECMNLSVFVSVYACIYLNVCVCMDGCIVGVLSYYFCICVFSGVCL